MSDCPPHSATLSTPPLFPLFASGLHVFWFKIRANVRAGEQHSLVFSVGSGLTLSDLCLKEVETGTKENTCHTLPSVSHTWQVSIFLTESSTFSDLFAF